MIRPESRESKISIVWERGRADEDDELTSGVTLLSKSTFKYLLLKK